LKGSKGGKGSVKEGKGGTLENNATARQLLPPGLVIMVDTLEWVLGDKKRLPDVD